MRERWARRLAILTCLLVLGLTAAFAANRNLGGQSAALTGVALTTTGGEEGIDPAQIEQGRDVYAAQGCAGCHSIAGEGSPRSPLDGVGSQLDRSQLREWIIGGDSIAEDLSPRALRVKRGYRDLEPEQLDALVEYMASLIE